ncbi:hypothetical protein M011DRAFT_475198 [Sporormia fimetaria CBS 119925]|uniref:Uncharacterized protein n=1 Tax=Sporormia fimetaria CBS 119925 TaxID=1340428 RepID=A0A6A6VJH0_9PLEO|nr:hypothetical protein M011DRAFT_475198 [Sporormia fimetaria CBS 119925]
MPSKFGWPKSNRSHSSADSSPGHPSPVPSVNNELQHPLPPTQQPLQQIPQGAYAQQQQQQFPARASSHRHSSHLTFDRQPLQTLQGGPLPPEAQHAQGIEQRRGSYQPQSSNYAQPEPQKKSLRSRITARLTDHGKDDDRHANKNGLGRRVSVRRSDGQQQQPDNFAAPGQDRLQPAKWTHRQGSSPHLPTSTEQDEDDLDPFLQHEDHDTTPQPPPKDIAYQQQQQRAQQFAANPHQQQYNRPPLTRVDTESSGSYHTGHTQGGVDHYSPDHHQQQQHQQQPKQQQQYQSYQPPVQYAQSTSEYQAFNPQTAPSPHPSRPSHDLSQQEQQLLFQQYQQQQQPTQQSQVLQPQSHQDAQQHPGSYPQQQFAHSSAQPQQGQEYAPRPSSQQQQREFQPAQPTQQVPQIVQQGQQIADPHQQQLRPPSSHQLAPPSPLQQPPVYQPYNSQQSGETISQNNTPQQQGQENMPATGGQRNTLRKVNEAGGSLPGAPSRESSQLQSPPAQGQIPGHPPVSPGLPSFGANVVPTASQGQPYRGDKSNQPGQVNEMGRATPPPRATSDLSDEEIANLIKEHETLREKYQKVKRYFFEQQSQVHALQNTIANQRMSLSRTSWDDSEYATRFNRLDGLIAQLSFAIRKDWKSIPPWLHTAVNKNAVETGKQEMTAVGKAFISSWLVDNIFDKYFHPDLEPSLSTQLRTIQLNIRKFSTPCQTTEEEDALVAKVVNWRLATLEGLTDLLRSPQCSTIRNNLIETLNESLIGSLQMFLNDPAPPDLNGGVPMIVELAISVAQHLPLESREVHIEYFPPGHALSSEYMNVETGIPALTSPILDHDDAASLLSVASKVDDTSSLTDQQPGDQQTQQQQPGPQGGKDSSEKKRGMFGFGASKKQNAPAQLGKRESSLGQGGSQQSLTQPQGQQQPPAPRVRMAVGLAVQIRGKSILIKAPVYST